MSKRANKISFLYEAWAEVRRLGILREIINIIGRQGIVSEKVLFDEILKMKEEINQFIDEYQRDPTGHLEFTRVTTTQRGTLKNYLTISSLLDLTRLIVTRRILSDYGKMVFYLPRRKNPINLTLHEKIAFLKKILEKDSTYFLLLLLVIRDNPKSVSDKFNKKLAALYKDLIKDHSMGRYRRLLRRQKLDIDKWASSRKTHMTSMRVSWAIDLDLCRKTKEGLSLTRIGHKIINSIPKRMLSAETPFFQCDEEFLEKEYFHTVNDCYEINAVEGEITTSELKQYIQKNFDKYTSRKLKMNKVSESPILERMALDFLIPTERQGIILEISYLRDKLRELAHEKENVYFVWDRRNRRGWIVLR